MILREKKSVWRGAKDMQINTTETGYSLNINLRAYYLPFADCIDREERVELDEDLRQLPPSPSPAKPHVASHRQSSIEGPIPHFDLEGMKGSPRSCECSVVHDNRSRLL